MKISTRDAQLLYIIGGLLLFVVLYMKVYTPMQEENAKMQSEIAYLENECKELEIQYAGMATYQAKADEYRKSVKEYVSSFPVDIKEEDIVAYLLDLMEENEIEVSNIGFGQPMEIVSFNGLMEIDGLDRSLNMVGKQITTNISAKFTYEKLKDVVNYIYNTPSQTTLESVSMSYSEQDDSLSGSFKFSRYTLSYNDAEYVPEKLPEVSIGQEDIFGAD